jgi:hypothetical protein
MRELYENSDHLKAENEFKLAIEKFTGAKLEKLPLKYHADHLAFRGGEPVFFTELKCRNCLKSTYNTYMISLNKVVNILAMCNLLKIPLLLYVQWVDFRGFVEIGDMSLYSIGMQSIDFRNDKGDIEPCIYIPIYLFQTMIEENI